MLHAELIAQPLQKHPLVLLSRVGDITAIREYLWVSPMDDEARFVRTSWVNVLTNLFKILIEGSIGLVFGSLALVADAANALGDLLISIAILTWGRLTYVGPDETHPHGHERVEPLVAFSVGLFLILVGLRLLYSALVTIINGVQGQFEIVLLGGLGAAIVIKSAQYVYTTRINQTLDSTSLRALSTDALIDIYVSLAAAVGVIGIALGLPVLDPVAAGLVSTLIVKEGIEITRENADYLTGAAPPKATCERIKASALSHSAVSGIHEFRAHYLGQDIEVEFHAVIDADTTSQESHTIETELKKTIGSIPDVKHVHVHLDPR
jgi:cation diffusion facilitator family transporter